VVADVEDEEDEGTATTTSTPKPPPPRPRPLPLQRPLLLLRLLPLRHPLLANSSRSSRPAEVEVVVVADAVDEVAEGTATTTSTPRPPLLSPPPLHPQRLLLPLRPHPPKHLWLPATKVSSSMPVISSILTRSWKRSCDRMSVS